MNADIYTALQPSRAEEGQATNFEAIVRLRDGANWAQAGADMDRAFRQSARVRRFQQSNPGAQGESPTLTIESTHVCLILGNGSLHGAEAGLLQAGGKRTDIWSWGVVLWEMLTGRRLFLGGETVSHMAEVLRAEIDFARLTPATPSPIGGLLQRWLDRPDDAFARHRRG